MNRSLVVGLGAAGAAAAFVVHQRRERKLSERLAAAALESLLSAIDANDPETGAHVRRVAGYALALARAAELDEVQQHSVERVALFHDIGKIHEALFDVLHDADRVTPEERRLIATHPRRGAEVLRPVSAFYPELEAGVLSHHERWDGTGYPRHLAGRRIPLEARIVSIADTFDAITHRRRYRRGRSLDEAATTMAAGRGTQFDPELVDLFLQPPVFDEIRDLARASWRPKRHRKHERRHPAHDEDQAPDISFRWRTRPTARHSSRARP